MRAMENVPAEENHIARLGVDRRLALVSQRHLRQRVDLHIGVADALDRFDIAQDGIALLGHAIAIGVDRLMLGARRHPKATVLFIG